MRVIVRFSLYRDKGGALTNKLRGILKNGRMPLQSSTGTYETDSKGVTPRDLAETLAEFWSEVHDATEEGIVKLDHFWMYTDKQKPSKKTKTARSKKRRTSKKETK